MAISNKRRRLVQPQYPAGVTDDPIGQLCQGLWYGSLTQDQVSRQAVARNTSGTVTRNLRGLAYSVTGTSALDRCVLNAPSASTTPGSGDFTAVVRFVLRNAQGYSALSRWYSGGSPSQSCWFLGANGQYGSSSVSADFIVAVGSTSYTATVSTGWAVGSEYMLVGTRTGTTIKIVRYSYSDGMWSTSSTTNAGITTVNNVTARALKLGDIDLGAAYNAQLDADFAAVFGRALSYDEIRALVVNPAVLAGKPRQILVPVSSGSPTYTSTLTESTTAAESLSAALSAVAAQAETVVAADALTAAATLLAALTETTTAADALSALLTAVAAVAEPATAAELLSTGTQYGATLTEPASSAETLAAAATLVALLTEPATAADAQAAAYPATYSVSVAELATALEVLAAVLGTEVFTAAARTRIGSPTIADALERIGSRTTAAGLVARVGGKRI